MTIIGLPVGALLSGAVLTETIFGLAGIGTDDLRVDHRAATTSSSRAWRWWSPIIFLIVNLVVDVCYGFLDPRVRLS